MSRRDFLGQGFRAGMATVLGGSIFSLFANPRSAQAALSSDLEAMRNLCGVSAQGAGKIPFICFDLAGGANIAGQMTGALQQGAKTVGQGIGLPFGLMKRNSGMDRLADATPPPTGGRIGGNRSGGI